MGVDYLCKKDKVYIMYLIVVENNEISIYIGVCIDF